MKLSIARPSRLSHRRPPSPRGSEPPCSGLRGRGASLVLAVTAVLAASAAAAPAPAATVPAAAARIVEVTVYPDRAEVIREGRIDVAAGASIVEFAGLPWNTEVDSLRVTAKGVPATLGAVEFRPQAGEPQESPALTAAREEVRRIELEIASLEAEEQDAKDLREFVNSLKATAVGEAGKIPDGRPDPNSIRAIYALIDSSLGNLSKEGVARADRRAKLRRDLEVARAKLAAAKPAGSIRTRTATVEIEARQAGALTLRLAYVAPGASWRPAYRASLDAATGEISFGAEGVVRQASGEDWTGVALRLSTAAPARGVDPPEMSSLLLRPIEYLAQAKGARTTGMVAMAPAPESLEAAAPGADADLAMQEEAVRQEAGVVHSAYNVAFEVPGKSDVPADGNEHRVGLKQETLKGTVAWRAVPALNEAAYLVAKSTSPSGYPLLAGPVRVFAGGAFLGAFALGETAPGSDITLPFGIDNRIAVKRVPLPQDRSRGGLFGKERRIAYGFRTTLENLRDQKATVVLEDRIPVSEDERIVVEMGEGTTPGFKELADRPGILEWSLDLGPKEKRDVVLEYLVRFPKDLIVPGLD